MSIEPTCTHCGLTTKDRCRSGDEAFACPSFDHTPFLSAKPPTSIASDGGETDYYKLPEGSTELNDLMEAKAMSFARGNIFKACYRMGEKQGIDIEYDCNKIIYFAERMKKMAKKGYKV